MPEADIVAIGFQTFLRPPELQRCAVILKDVLGHSVDEIASIAACSPAAAKSALQRGRAALRLLAQAPEDIRLPLMPDSDRGRSPPMFICFGAAISTQSAPCSPTT
jgi:hypothetical protein